MRVARACAPRPPRAPSAVATSAPPRAPADAPPAAASSALSRLSCRRGVLNAAISSARCAERSKRRADARDAVEPHAERFSAGMHKGRGIVRKWMASKSCFDVTDRASSRAPSGLMFDCFSIVMNPLHPATNDTLPHKYDREKRPLSPFLSSACSPFLFTRDICIRCCCCARAAPSPPPLALQWPSLTGSPPPPPPFASPALARARGRNRARQGRTPTLLSRAARAAGSHPRRSPPQTPPTRCC